MVLYKRVVAAFREGQMKKTNKVTEKEAGIALAEASPKGVQHLKDALDLVVPRDCELLPQVNEVYELQLAYMESLALTKEELRKRGAYFAKVGGEYTDHYNICFGRPLQVSKNSSMRLKSFFETNMFKTGYATHGLFPYRGKFHAQMIKALLNIMKVRPGEDTVLDPMMGSGTTLIESALLGIESIGFDINPFCVLMARAKVAGLTLPLDVLKAYLEKAEDVFEYFDSQRKASVQKVSKKRQKQPSLFDFAADSNHDGDGRGLQPNTEELKNFLQLAYLDALGFEARRKGDTAAELFKEVIAKYVIAVEKIQSACSRLGVTPARAEIRCGDARNTDLESESIGGVLFSPPYSFAIDYIENDARQLEYLGYDTEDLRKNLVGLRGGGGEAQVKAYFEDMDRIIQEMYRVLKKDSFCTIVVGSNTKQLSRTLNLDEDKVVGIEERLVEYAEKSGFRLAHRIIRQITGMHNVMRNEFILMLYKPA